MFYLLFSCRDTLEVYSMELKSLAMNLISKMGKVLNIKDEELREFFDNGFQSMRMTITLHVLSQKRLWASPLILMALLLPFCYRSMK